MVTEIRIYYEGGRLLKPGFHAFFTTLRERAREKRCNFHLIAAKGTPGRDFRIAIKTHPDAWNILLKDSEGPDSGALSASFCKQNEWSQSHAESIFWMVEVMESWFHADKAALERFYGPGFKRNALKANPNVERISKKDLKDGLSAATKGTSKGDYFDHKTSHGPELLAAIKPDLVQDAAHHCQKLFQAVLAKLTADC
jgi:Domain of unknown function (DUF4276)